MRELIKPGLFWVTRLGLFLSVVTWVVGQWWALLSVVGSFTCFSDSTGFGVVYLPQVSGPSFPTVVELDSPDYWWTQVLIDADFYKARHVVGIMVSSQAIRVGHWLIVTIFATFYGVLKWVYRKRGAEAVADE